MHSAPGLWHPNIPRRGAHRQPGLIHERRDGNWFSESGRRAVSGLRLGLAAPRRDAARSGQSPFCFRLRDQIRV